jgi:hypothetical protein
MGRLSGVLPPANFQHLQDCRRIFPSLAQTNIRWKKVNGWVQITARTAERIRLEKAAKSRQHGPDNDADPAVNHINASWLYGWTHYGTSGQTPARLHPYTREVEIKDGDEWVRCVAGTDAFFTRDYLSA